MPLSPGQILNNRYRIVQQLGVGGFGAVYKAMDIHLKVSCAVKENFDTSPEAERQFAREANILATLHHPNLPRVTDHFSLPGQGQYLVMDFVEGQDLEKVMEQAKQQAKGPLPEAQVLEWAEQVCAALAYLHAHQPPVIHRDIKPANIRLTPGGKAMLVDFGIAKFYDPKQRTTQGARAVTPGFSPPEQYGQKSTDGRTDIYALGATLYMLLSGQAPPESIERVTGTPLPPLRSLNPAVSPQTEQVVHAAMALLPDDRYASILELAAALSGQTLSLPAAQSGSQPLVTQILPGTPGYPGALASSQTPATTLPPGYLPGTPPTASSSGLPVGQSYPASTTGARRPAKWTWAALGGGLVACLLLLVAGFFVLRALQPALFGAESSGEQLSRPTATTEAALAQGERGQSTLAAPTALPTKKPTEPPVTATPVPSTTPTATPVPPTPTPELPFYNVRACVQNLFDGDQCASHQELISGPLSRVYGSWNFRQVTTGMEIRRDWYLDGAYYWSTINIVGENTRWSSDQPTFWIYIDSGEGSAGAAFGYPSSLPPGNYRMEMFLDSRYITTLSFTIRNP